MAGGPEEGAADEDGRAAWVVARRAPEVEAWPEARPASSSLPPRCVSARMRTFVSSVVMCWCAGGAELWSHRYGRTVAPDAREA